MYFEGLVFCLIMGNGEELREFLKKLFAGAGFGTASIERFCFLCVFF